MFKQRESRIRHIAVAVIALAAIFISGYTTFLWSREQAIVALDLEADRKLESAAAALFAPTDKFSYLPEIVADHPQVVDSLLHKEDAERQRQTSEFLYRLNRGARSAVIYVLDEHGTTLMSSNWQDADSFVGKNYAYRPYFQDAIRTGAGRFYGIGATSRTPGYYVSHVIRRGSDVLGVAVVKVDMTTLDQSWDRGKDEVVVTDENGVIFLSTLPAWKYQPMQPLSDDAMSKLRRTRQYDGVLKPALSMRTTRQQSHGTQLVDIAGVVSNSTDMQPVTFLLKSNPLAGSGWTINVLMPTADADAHALRVALMTAGALALVALSLMVLQQRLARSRERDKSRMALEQAHEALERKHSELKKISDELRIISITDPLTGAHNRRFFFEAAPKLLSAARRHRFPLSVITIDADHFKRINDRYGHPAGDKVLQVLTAICKDSLREEDIFARFGGEEFVMVLSNGDAESARRVAERLRIKVTEHPIDLNGTLLPVTVSCGVSQYKEGETGIEQALKRADEALYAAKKAGRNQVVVH